MHSLLDDRIFSNNDNDLGTYVGQTTYNIKSGQILVWQGDSWIPCSPTEHSSDHRKKELMEEFDKNPELYNEIVTEMRRKKIERLKK